MDRKEFLKTCGFACLGASVFTTLLQGCVSTNSVTANIEGENIVVPLSNFMKDGKKLNYLIISNAKLQYPIYLFRFSDSEYSALFMQCTHQGNELSAFGEKLVCSAHGSEFDNKGAVTNGPASDPLRTFPLKLDSINIIISLKKA